MGYAHTNMVLFGVQLNEWESKSFVFEMAKLLNEESGMDQDELDGIRDAIGENDVNSVLELVNESGVFYDHFPIKSVGKYKCEMRSNDTDSRIHIQEGYESDATIHTVGVFCGANGYGCDDDITSLIKSEPTTDCFKLYDKLEPILKAIGVTQAPTVHLVGQVH